jgi:hypothetical protein
MYILYDEPESQVLSEIKKDGTFEWAWHGGKFLNMSYSAPIDPSEFPIHIFKKLEDAFAAIEEAKRQFLLEDPEFPTDNFDFKVYKLLSHTVYTVYKEMEQE